MLILSIIGQINQFLSSEFWVLGCYQHNTTCTMLFIFLFFLQKNVFISILTYQTFQVASQDRSLAGQFLHYWPVNVWDQGLEQPFSAHPSPAYPHILLWCLATKIKLFNVHFLFPFYFYFVWWFYFIFTKLHISHFIHTKL